MKSLLRGLFYLLCLFSALLLTSVSVAKLAVLHPIKVGIDLWPGYYPIIIAKRKGFFKAAGLDVSYVLPEETNNLMALFSDNKIDMLCVAMGDGFALYDKDKDMRVVMITDESLGGDALLKKGVLPKVGEPLKVGTNLKGFGELFVRRFIEDSEYSIKEVTWVQQEASQAMEYLRSGKADIVHTWEPYVSEVIKYYGAEKVFDSRQTPGLIPDALLANGQFIKQYPEQLKGFVAAWLKGAKWWLENRAEGDEIISAELLLLPGSLSLKGLKLFTLEDNQAVFRKGKNMESVFHVAEIYLEYFKSKQTFKQLPLNAQGIVSGDFIPH